MDSQRVSKLLHGLCVGLLSGGGFDKPPYPVGLRQGLRQLVQLREKRLQFRAVFVLQATLQIPQEVPCLLRLTQPFGHLLAPFLHRRYLPISLSRCTD